jgi:hypothetical protein
MVYMDADALNPTPAEQKNGRRLEIRPRRLARWYNREMRMSQRISRLNINREADGSSTPCNGGTIDRTSRHNLVRVLVVYVAATMVFLPGRSLRAAATVTYVGVIYDQTDFDSLNIGNAGYWFPQFDAPAPVEGRPTDENVREALPSWAGPLNHATSIFDPNYSTRTFSQDGPARSKGGQPTWNTFTLPDGEVGLSGAIVDPYTIDNSNNTINRIQLNAGVPATFYFHVVTDNTNFEHDPTNRLRARGNAGGVNIDPSTYPQTADLSFNGIADVYTFRYDGFAAGDYIKLQLNGDPAPAEGASFGGFLFDETFEPTPTLPGDYNDDGTVDAADYVDWRKRNGPPDEYETWRANFGLESGSGSGIVLRSFPTVPEPSGVALMAAGLVVLICLPVRRAS